MLKQVQKRKNEAKSNDRVPTDDSADTLGSSTDVGHHQRMFQLYTVNFLFLVIIVIVMLIHLMLLINECLGKTLPAGGRPE